MTRAILKEFSTVKKGASKHVDKSSVVNLAKKRKAALKKQRQLNAKRLKVLNDSLTAARNVRGANFVWLRRAKYAHRRHLACECS